VPERRGSEAGLVALPAVRMKREDEDADYRYSQGTFCKKSLVSLQIWLEILK
jgi:hypothetical protein